MIRYIISILVVTNSLFYFAFSVHAYEWVLVHESDLVYCFYDQNSVEKSGSAMSFVIIQDYKPEIYVLKDNKVIAVRSQIAKFRIYCDDETAQHLDTTAYSGHNGHGDVLGYEGPGPRLHIGIGCASLLKDLVCK